MDSMILAGIPIAVCYWFLDSILQIFASGQYNFIAFFFGPNLYEIYTRITVLCLFVIFGSHAQNTINRLRQTREALNESKENYRTVADFTYHWEYWVSEKGQFIYMSPSCARISGYRVEEFQQNPQLLNQIIHPADRQRVAEHFVNESATRRAQSFEYRIVSRDGQERWIDHICQPVYGSDGRYRGKRAGNSDISAVKKEKQERELAEKKLLKYRDHLENLLREHSDEMLETQARLKAEIKERKLNQKAFEAALQFLQIAYRQHSLQPLLIEFVRAIQEQTALASAGVQLLEPIEKVHLKFFAGFKKELYDAISRLSISPSRDLCNEEKSPAGLTGNQTCSEYGSMYINSTTKHLFTHHYSRTGRIIQLFKDSGFETLAMIPLRVETNSHGYIYVADPRKDMINMRVLDLLEGAAMQLEIAVKRIQAEAASQKPAS